MIRDYPLYRLLEHGPLTFDECVKIGGWPPEEVRDALARLKQQHVACINDGGRRLYRVGRTDRNAVRRAARAKARLLDPGV